MEKTNQALIKNCVIYARSSHWGDQKSIDKQMKECESFANTNGLKVEMRLKENCSGYLAPMHKRARLLATMSYVESHKIQAVLVRDISRLSRSVLQGAQMLYWFRLMGVAVIDVEYMKDKKLLGAEEYFGFDYHAVLYEKLIKAERYYHEHTDVPRCSTSSQYSGRKVLLGYKRDEHNSTRLVKDPEIAGDMEAFFAIAIRKAESIVGKSSSKKMNYAQLFRELNQDNEPRQIIDRLNSSGQATKKIASNDSLRSMLQNPVYAGYSDDAFQEEEPPRVHEQYIDVKDFNLLNKDYRTIKLPRKTIKTYVSLVSCICGDGKLNKSGEWVVCSKCNRRGSGDDLVKAISTCLAGYRFSNEYSVLTHMERRLKMGKFSLLIEKIRDSLHPRQESAGAIIDDDALQHKAISSKDLKTMADLLSAIDSYHEKGFGDLAVLWLEAHQAGEGRIFLEEMNLNLVHDTKTGDTELVENNANIVKSPSPISLEEVQEKVDARRNKRQEIFGLLSELSWLKAVLEYDVGIASGDFWTDFEDQLKD